MERARTAVLTLARRVGEDLGMPVFLYGELGAAAGRRSSGTGGLDELARRIERVSSTPDFGPSELDPASGRGARRRAPAAVAFNVDLRTDDLEVARAIAAVVRERGGGFPGVRALGFALPSRGLVQVSMNVEDLGARRAVRDRRAVRAEAAARGVEIGGLGAGRADAGGRGGRAAREPRSRRPRRVRLLESAARRLTIATKSAQRARFRAALWRLLPGWVGVRDGQNCLCPRGAAARCRSTV